MPPVPTTILQRCIRSLVGAIDATLRHIRGVREFELEREGLIRIELGRAEQEVLLSDGTWIEAGDRVMELHLWNEHLPSVPARGADFRWAVQIRRQTLASLQRLARHFRDDRRLDEVRALRVKPGLASQKMTDRVARVLSQIGFELVADSAPGYLPRFLDNVWLWLLTCAHNPRALRGRQFQRKRCEFWTSRARFLALHADVFAAPAHGADPAKSFAPKNSATIEKSSSG